MRNIIIIGPPASGKLTIARALAEAKGYFLFDNHRSIDAVSIINKNQSIAPTGLCRAIRKCVFEIVVAQNIPTVFTLVYAHPVDENEMNQFSSLLKTSKWPLIVQLHCSVEDATLRCLDISREGTSKITTVAGVKNLFTEYDLNSDYRPSSDNVLHINTSITALAESLKMIFARI